MKKHQQKPPPATRKACSSHRQIVIWICFWFDKLNQFTNSETAMLSTSHLFPGCQKPSTNHFFKNPNLEWTSRKMIQSLRQQKQHSFLGLRRRHPPLLFTPWHLGSISIIIVFIRSICAVLVMLPNPLALWQGGRSWQAFGERKKCLKFFRRTRIC